MHMNKKLLQTLIENKDFKQIKNNINNMNIPDVAELIEELDNTYSLLIFRLLNKITAARVFSYISRANQKKFLLLVNEKELKKLTDELFLDDKVDLVEEMPANLVKKILKTSDEKERKLINQFLKYPKDSAGSLMTIEFIDLKKELTAAMSLERIKKLGYNKETIYTSYVITNTRVLEGIIELKDLVLEDSNEKIENIMSKNVIYVNTHDDQEYVASIFKKYDLLSIPVVDNEKRLVGIITIDDIMDVVELENTEDIHRMAAIEPSHTNYLDENIFILAKRRIIWLLVLMISATFTGLILSRYEEALESVVALTFFIPMLMDTGGNAGSQASTLIIRSITLEEIQFKDIFKVILKELGVSSIVGIILAILNFLRIYFIQGYSIKISLIVTMTLMLTVMLAKIVGGILPLIAKKAKLDPAIMASPLVTTIVDTFSLIVYFRIATLILKI
ncbi:magnesium transporter [Senegalia massiliensis]|uniref:Magnesium transporter MgtE n=2 Tax=Senegalia massiliensis TaxID=1720316 RepID=A0A845QR81_9CLOT|nr:magnesium transporter [Senegalia massiliensis]